MGIEDLNLNHEELAERVLLISGSDRSVDQISRLLDLRSYSWQHVKSFVQAKELSRHELYDLIIYEQNIDEPSVGNIIEYFQVTPGLRSPALLVLSIDSLSKNNTQKGERVQIVELPFKPSDLMVKISTLLRLRKTKKDESRAESSLLQQNAELRDLTNRVKAELKEAREIQKQIMPASLPRDPTVIFASTYIPFEAVGGDLFDIWKIRDNCYGFFIGDVTGHGLSAAFIGAMTKMALSYSTKESPENMLAQMNEGVSNLMPGGKFVTAAAAIYRSDSGRLQVSVGGHPSPYIYRAADSSIEEVPPGGLPLGIIEDTEYELFETELAVGDKFMMVTDGLTEAANMEGEMLGVAGIGEFVLQAARKHQIAEAITQVLIDLQEFTGGRVVKDDMTIVGLERRAT